MPPSDLPEFSFEELAATFGADIMSPTFNRICSGLSFTGVDPISAAGMFPNVNLTCCKHPCSGLGSHDLSSKPQPVLPRELLQEIYNIDIETLDLMKTLSEASPPENIQQPEAVPEPIQAGLSDLFPFPDLPLIEPEILEPIEVSIDKRQKPTPPPLAQDIRPVATEPQTRTTTTFEQRISTNPRYKTKVACENCARFKLACDANRPCSRCSSKNRICIDREHRRRKTTERPRKRSHTDMVDGFYYA
uniref:Zn(2)-C6 fungal-type domain-containing protein n=1 Tax=Spongospora subterranea TaxID=70186 RepID=A0A0H5RB43_9EUKA|eukprot:CRZ11258.1 hypothetical protein [Spongospora subterranea]